MQLFFFFSCLADLLILLYVITKACSREQIIKGLREISNGNLQYKIPLERLWGDDKHIAEYIEKEYGGQISGEEIMFLAIHIKRVCMTD